MGLFAPPPLVEPDELDSSHLRGEDSRLSADLEPGSPSQLLGGES